MSLKRHCETCDATAPKIALDGWLHVGIEDHLPVRSMTYGMHDMIKGDYCSPICLVKRIISIPTMCVQVEQTVREHMEGSHDT